MRSRACTNWSEIEEDLARFFELDATKRRRYLFRGHADSAWKLDSTLRRFAISVESENRESLMARLIQQFQVECAKVGTRLATAADDNEWMLFARHHGVPSPILDWTRSPYVAMFFACADPRHDRESPPKSLALYLFDLDTLERLPEEKRGKVEIIDEPRLILSNPRALEQQSIFLRVADDWENDADSGIFRWTLPASRRSGVLARLESMGITHTALLRTLDAAAQTASWRAVELERKSEI
jgi:hypothetical protein